MVEIKPERIQFQNNILTLGDDINTDLIFPTRFAFNPDADLGEFALTGLNNIEPGQIRSQHINVVAAGINFGCGSAREQAPLSLLKAGVELVVAKSIDPIFQRNCANVGLLTSTDLSLLARLEAGEVIPRDEILNRLPTLEAAIIKYGGLIEFTQAVQDGEIELPAVSEIPKPMTMLEKMIALNLGGNAYPQAGDIVSIKPDVLASYEFFTALIFKLLEERGLSPRAIAKLRLFSDHTVASQRPEARQLLENHAALAIQHGAHYFPYYWEDQSSTGVGHALLAEMATQLGEIVLMTDSHTSHYAGVGGFGLATSLTGITAALATGEYIFQLPESVRIQTLGCLPENVTSFDLILYLLNLNKSADIYRGRCLEIGGLGLNGLLPDQLSILANMAIEGHALTALIEPTDDQLRAISQLTQQPYDQLRQVADLLKSDQQATYSHSLRIDVSGLKPAVALPGSPANFQILEEITNKPKVDIVYVGGCIGGTWSSLLDVVNTVRGRQVHLDTKFYVQPATEKIAAALEKTGLKKVLLDAGITILGQACGACCSLGPGSPELGQTAVFTTNRNWQGRNKGDIYLAGSNIAAATAIKGYLCHPEEL